MSENSLNPSQIIKVGLGFFNSKVLLAAVNFQLFTILAKHGKLSPKQIKDFLGLKCIDRHLFDFLDILVALKFLHREGLLETAFYSNSKETDFFLDKNKPSYIGSLLDMASSRFYPFWSTLEEGLKTGKAQNQSKSGIDIFTILYSDPQKLTSFVKTMEGIQSFTFKSFAQEFDFKNYKTLLDVGGSGGLLSITVAKNNPHLTCKTMDLPAIQPIANANIQKHGVSSQVQAIVGDFFKDSFPKADVVVMGNILHDWGQQQKEHLMREAYAAVNEGGVFVVIESVIDNQRRENIMGMGMSLHMLIETSTGFNFTQSDFDGWAKAVGFKSTKLVRFGQTALIAYK